MFAALAAYGHTYPLMPLAVAARKAGHQVIFAGGDEMLAELRAADLEAVPAGMNIREAFGEVTQGVMPTEPTELATAIGRVFGEVLPRRWVADLVPLIETHRPDLIVQEMGTLGAALAGAVTGVPTVGHTFGRAAASEMGEVMQQTFGEFATELGHGDFDLNRRTTMIDICPESVQSAEFLQGHDRIPLRPVGWSGPGELPAGIRERDRSRPLVYLTLGTAFGNADVLKQAIAGLAALPVDVLVATGPTVDLAALGPVPDSVRLEAWVPQSELLPHVDLVVHHGGSGTMLGGLSAGRPQLLVPQGADQFTNGEVVVEVGAGSVLLPADFSADAITESVRTLLADEAVHATVRRLAEEIAAMPDPEEVADRLPSLAESAR